MTTTSESTQTKEKKNTVKGIIARAVQILIMFIVMGLELFLGSGRLNWVWAWVFLGIGLLSLSINAVFMLRTSPETVAERGRPKEVKDWDKLVGGAWLIGQYFLMPILAALDIRFGWTKELATLWHVLGAAVYGLSLGLTGWAMITNAYFSTAVRIQADRGQQVCTTGPYHYVRHPGYVGFFFQALSVPIVLGSLWALLFTIPAGVLMIIRTAFEDRMLQEELEGYKEYTREVRYRLLPGVW
jgi:protein-S-isoprenylcysteine O-methyltransferase Ste14